MISFPEFTYSKKSHFSLFKRNNYDVKLYGFEVNPEECDLKVYQDLLMFSYLRENLFPGAKILEIGGGDSRILDFFQNEFECWNLDKLEGLGNGPKSLDNKNYKIILDYIGSFNPELPENYFDFVFSISALEHVTVDDYEMYDKILKDIDRVLKTGGISFHCIDHSTDLLLGTVAEVWTNPLITFFYENEKIINDFIPLVKAEEDPDLFVVPEKFYNANWLPVTKVFYKDFGKPFSYNILWKKL